MTAPKTIHGVDVASFQGDPGQWAAAAGKIRWAGVKVTEVSVNPDGSLNVYVNPDAAADLQYLTSKKLGRIPYLFGHPAAPVQATVDAFATEMQTLGLEDTDGIMLDLEVTDGLAPAQVDAWAAEVLADLGRRFRRHPVVYTFIDFVQAGNTASLGKYPLWIAAPSYPAGEPFVPAPWTDWVIDQYDLSGAIDRDVAKFPTLAAMQKALGKHETPEDEPMKMMSAVILEDAVTVPADRRPVALRWRAEAGEQSLLNGQGDGQMPGAGACLSSVNVRVAQGVWLKFAVTEMLEDGKPGRAVESEFPHAGGWTQFTAPFPAAAGATYLVTVTNFGAVPAKISEGTWELYR